MDIEDILTKQEKKIFLILVSICLFVVFTYFIVKVLTR